VGYLFLLASDAEVAEFERSVELQNRLVLLDAPIAGGWWGDYEMTLDRNALIGEGEALSLPGDRSDGSATSSSRWLRGAARGPRAGA
jgi:hypothetical protein